MKTDFAYIRASSNVKIFSKQLETIRPYISDEKYIYTDKACIKDEERIGFQNMLKIIESGDVLYVQSIKCLGRNKSQIKRYLEYFKKEGIRIKILDLPTTLIEVTTEDEWIIEIINDILIEIYTSMSKHERESIFEEQSKGIATAKVNGKHLGRPKIELPVEWDKLYKEWKTGTITATEFMNNIGMKKATFYNKVKEYESKDNKSSESK